MKNNLINFTKERLKKEPIQYTVIFIHDEKGMSFEVYDIQDSQKDRLAVARDFEVAAECLKNES